MMSGSARNATMVCNEPNTPLRVSGVNAMTEPARLAISPYSSCWARMVTGSVLRSLDAQRNTSATVLPPRWAANR